MSHPIVEVMHPFPRIGGLGAHLPIRSHTHMIATIQVSDRGVPQALEGITLMALDASDDKTSAEDAEDAQRSKPGDRSTRSGSSTVEAHERRRRDEGKRIRHDGDYASTPLMRPRARGTPRERHRLLSVLFAGVIVTSALVVYGLVHKPDYTIAFFASSRAGILRLKSEIGTAVLGLGILQLLLALWIWGRLPGIGSAPRAVGRVHRVTGMLLFLVTLPVAVHCMRAYGVRTSSLRATVHSLTGCFFYGAFAAKILVVRSRSLPGWALPVAGGVLVVAIAVIWYSSALWFFNDHRLPLG